MGKQQRRKGHDFERETARKYKRIGFEDARRHWEYSEHEAEKGIDVHGVYPFAVQCKAWKNYPPMNKLEEVNADETEIPVLHAKGNYKKPVVVLYEDDWMELVETIKAEKII